MISDMDPYRLTIEEASLSKEIYALHNLQKSKDELETQVNLR